MKFICRKFEFDPAHYTTAKEINFFNPRAEITQIAEVDLTDYIILGSVGDNSYKSPNVDAQTNNYYFEANGVSFQVSAAKDNNYLLSFFEVTTKAINYRWVLIQENDEGEVVFYSFITKDRVEVDSLENRILTINTVSYEVEFKTWWSSQPLFSLSTWDYRPFSINGTPMTKFEARNIKSLFEDIFTSNFLSEVVMHGDLSGWYVSRYPYFFLPFSDFHKNQMDILSGYDVFVHQQISCFEYFSSMCKAMGWKWFFYQGVLHIDNLYSTSGSVIDIDYEKLGENGVIETGIENTFLDLKIEAVVLPNGYLDGGSDSTINIPYGVPQKNYNIAGDRKVIYRKDFYTNAELTRGRYKLVGTYGSSRWGYAGIEGIDFECLRFKDDDLGLYRWDYIREQGISEEPRSSIYTLDKDKTLVIDVACNTELITRIDMHNTRFSSTAGDIYYGQYQIDKGSPVTSEEDLEFAGNVANALFRFDTGLNKFVTYNWYINESQQFKDNFSTYLGTDLLQLVYVKGDGIQYNPLHRYRIVNYPPELLQFDNTSFAMHELRYNLQDRTFELKIITTK